MWAEWISASTSEPVPDILPPKHLDLVSKPFGKEQVLGDFPALPVFIVISGPAVSPIEADFDVIHAIPTAFFEIAQVKIMLDPVFVPDALTHPVSTAPIIFDLYFEGAELLVLHVEPENFPGEPLPPWGRVGDVVLLDKENQGPLGHIPFWLWKL
jgi:hypothetical protein